MVIPPISNPACFCGRYDVILIITNKKIYIQLKYARIAYRHRCALNIQKSISAAQARKNEVARALPNNTNRRYI